MRPDVARLLQSAGASALADYMELLGREPAVPRRGRPAGDLELIAIISPAAGAGRTFLAAGLAHAFAARGRRALAYDLDPSAALSLRLCGPPRAGAPGAGEPVFHPCGPRLSCVAFGPAPLHVIPRARLEADVAILDLPAGTGGVVEDALANVDTVLVVLRPDASSCAAARKLEESLARVRRTNWRHSPACFVANRFDARRASDRTAWSLLNALLGPRLLLHVQDDESVARCGPGQSLADVAPESQARADLDALAALLDGEPTPAHALEG